MARLVKLHPLPDNLINMLNFCRNYICNDIVSMDNCRSHTILLGPSVYWSLSLRVRLFFLLAGSHVVQVVEGGPLVQSQKHYKDGIKRCCPCYRGSSFWTRSLCKCTGFGMIFQFVAPAST